MKRWNLSFIVLNLFFAVHASALVDMRNANYSNTWVDLQMTGSGYDLRIARTYNSRTLFNGIFGFGWCSDFETKLDITPEGNLKLTECGAGRENYYMPREFSHKEIEHTAAQIMSALRTQHKMDERSLLALQKELPINDDLRAKWALQLKIAVPVKDGTRFYANGLGVENVLYSKGFYTRTLVDGTEQRFNHDGHLTHIYDKNGNYIKVEYDKDLIREITDNSARRLSFKFYNNKKVKTITGPNGIVVEYKFERLDDLTWVKNAWNNVYSYQYDELHNLVKAIWPDNTFVALTYDKKHDWVTSFVDREKCRENYVYDEDPKEPKFHYWSIVKKTCGKDVITESRYEFWHKTKADGEPYLWKVSSVINGNATEIVYHEAFGRPVSMRRGGELFTYDYYPNGQVKQKSTKFATLTYEYARENGKVSKVVAVHKNEKGAVVRIIKSEFRYDKKNNLVWAANSEGQKVDMTYDVKGRIATIRDQAKKVVRIDYDERSGRPAIVTRPGLGTIRVTYKANGEIDKVNSNEGPAVAMQVASTFNNLLEIIAPASAEVYN